MGTLYVVDLFAGAGGLSHGFHLAGAHPAVAVEADRWACDTFEHNHSSTNVICADIRMVEGSAIQERLGKRRATLVVGGPPCQGFSIANKNNGDPKDP